MCQYEEFYYSECNHSVYALIPPACLRSEMFNNGYCPDAGVVAIHIVNRLCPACSRYPTPESSRRSRGRRSGSGRGYHY
jgi:hypothetical protein